MSEIPEMPEWMPGDKELSAISKDKSFAELSFGQWKREIALAGAQAAVREIERLDLIDEVAKYGQDWQRIKQQLGVKGKDE